MTEEAGTPKIISRAEAKLLGLRRYFTGKPCSKGHVAERFVSSGVCAECNRLANLAWAASNREYNARRHRAWRASNPERVRELKRASYMRNAAGIQARRRYRQTEADREEARRRASQWYSEHKARALANIAKRRAARLKATPPWLTQSDLLAMTDRYATAKAISRLTGQQHHVDHIVPLQGETVCGLHVPWNLQILPAGENIAKSNKLLAEAACAPPNTSAAEKNWEAFDYAYSHGNHDKVIEETRAR